MADIYGEYNNMSFNDVFPTKEEFLKAYNNEYFPKTISDENAGLLWALLKAKHDNDIVASGDIGRFHLSVFSIIYKEGPIWEKRMSLQSELRGLSSDELLKAATNKVVMNRAENPASFIEEGTGDDYLIQQINSQTSQISKASKLSAIASLNMLMEDVTEPFLQKFKGLFLTIVQFDSVALYGNVD